MVMGFVCELESGDQAIKIWTHGPWVLDLREGVSFFRFAHFLFPLREESVFCGTLLAFRNCKSNTLFLVPQIFFLVMIEQYLCLSVKQITDVNLLILLLILDLEKLLLETVS